MSEGLFIALEGIDGSGTTTQCERLTRALRTRGDAVHATREPSSGPVGTLLRQALTKRFVVPGPDGPAAPGWGTMALLFAADRLDHVEAEVAPRLADGVHVVTDRYVHSSLAYQTLSGDGEPGATLPWVREINRHARAPDLTVVLDVSAEAASERRAARGGTPELYEVDALQRRLADFYADIERHFPGQRLVHVDGERDAGDVAADVLAAVDALLT